MSYARRLPGNAIAPSISAVESVDQELRTTKLSFFFLLVFTALYYARPEDVLPALIPLHLPEVVAICAIIGYILARLRGGAPVVWSAELKIMLGLTLCFAASVPFSIWRWGSLTLLTQAWLKTLLIFFLLTQTVLTLARLRKLLWAILLCELFVSCVSILTAKSLIVEEGQRLQGATLGILSGNEFSIVVATTLPFLVAFLVESRSILKSGLLLATAGIVMRMTVLNASRGGVICLAMCLVLLLVMTGRSIFRGKVTGLILVAVVIGVAAFAPSVFWERIRTTWDEPKVASSAVTESAVASTAQRKALFRRSIEYTLENPIFGLGLGNFIVASGTRTGRASEWAGTHNSFTQVSSEAGIPALLLYLGLMLVTSRNMRTLSRECADDPVRAELELFARAALVSICTFMVGAFFAHLAYNLYSYYLIAVAIGLQTVMRRAKTVKSTPAVSGEPRIGRGRA